MNININKIKQNQFLVSILFSLSFSNPILNYLLFNSILLVALSQIFYFVSLYFLLLNSYWWKSYFINLLILISLLCYSEIIFRFIFSEYIVEDLYQIEGVTYFNKPFLEKKFNDKEYSVLYRTDKYGFRIDQSMIDDKDVEQCDWLFLGDSFTQGAQVEYSELFTSQLYRLEPNKIIINAGISGFGIAQEYYFYKYIYPKLKPKKVFLQFCNFNDFMNVELKEPGLSEYLMQYSDLARSILYNVKYQSPGQLPLGRWTEPFYSTEKENIDYNIFYRETSSQKLHDLHLFGEYFKQFVEQVKKDGCELIVLLVPTKEQLYYNDFNDVISAFNINPNKLDMNYPNRLMDSLCEINGVTLIDMYKIFGESKARVFFKYDEHLNPLGHKLIAETINKFMEKPNDPISMISKTFEGQRYPSLDGTELIYQSFVDGNSELFSFDLLTNNINRITYNNVDEFHPSRNIKNNVLVFTEGDHRFNETEIVISDTNDLNRSTITSKKNEYGSIPSLSRNADLITYASWYLDTISGNYTQPEIVLYNIQNKERFILTSNNLEDWRPVFKDSNNIIYISKVNGQFDIFKIEVSSGNISQLTYTEYDEWDPRISPSGRYIIYTANKNLNWNLFEIDLKENTTRQLTDTKGIEWDPNYGDSDEDIYFAGVYGHFNGIYRLQLERIKN